VAALCVMHPALEPRVLFLKPPCLSETSQGLLLSKRKDMLGAKPSPWGTALCPAAVASITSSRHLRESGTSQNRVLTLSFPPRIRGAGPTRDAGPGAPASWEVAVRLCGGAEAETRQRLLRTVKKEVGVGAGAGGARPPGHRAAVAARESVSQAGVAPGGGGRPPQLCGSPGWRFTFRRAGGWRLGSGVLMTPPIYARVQLRCAHLRMPTLECSQHLRCLGELCSPAGCPYPGSTWVSLSAASVFQVKQIMEEAVTRKFVHEDSSHIISFCAAVEACVLHGLRRRAAGFLRSNKIAALFMKVGKSFPPAEELSRKVQDLEQLIESARNQIQGLQENVRKLPKLPNLSPLAIKHLWIRTALFEKVLDKIVHYLVENSSKYYEKDALLMDPVDGPILASLLVGPCALEYTKMKTADHFWTDPSADELVQRHRIHSAHLRQDSPTKRPALCIQKRHSSGSMDDRPSLSARDYVESLHQNSRATLLYGKNNVLVQPRDDMEAVPGYLSLHQTADVMTLKWTPNQLMNGSVGDLDYEKSVYWDYAMTIRLEEIVYLHCHQQVDSGGTVVLVSQDGIQRPPFRFPKGGHLLQFLSCLENGLLPHGQLDPPLWSQRGKVSAWRGQGGWRTSAKGRAVPAPARGACGLVRAPPSPWRDACVPGMVQRDAFLQGKVFPKLRKRSPQGSAESTSSDKDDDEATDYVFRIIYPGMQSEFVAPDPLSRTSPVSAGPAWMVVPAGRSTLVVARDGQWAWTRWDATLPTPGLKQQPPSNAYRGSPSALLPTAVPQDMMEVSVSNLPSLWQPSPRKSSCSSCSQSGSADGGSANGCNHERAPLKLLCDNMKYQILSRAFYGWLAYCRHLSTVRTHLSALVNHMIVSPDLPRDAGRGLTAGIWEQYLQDSTSFEEQELLRLIYYGGIQPEIRRAVWPFLLGHYQFGMTETERKEVDEQIHACYAQTMSEWLGCEAIVRQRERESHAAALAKCSSGASLDSHLHRMMHRDSTISNESSQSCSSGRQNLRLQSDSSSSTQVFESVDEVEQVEAEGRLEEKQPKGPNGTLVNGTCSPDSGHPSSHNFSSGLSEHSEPSLSTEDSVMDAHRNAVLVLRPGDSSVDDGQSSEATTSRDEAPCEELAVQDSLESDLLANESMDEFMSVPGSMDVALPEKEGPSLEGWGGSKVEKHSQADSEDNLSEEPEMESLFPALASLAVTTSANEASPVSSSGVTYSPELLDLYTVNLHRIEKDVQRCDRNYWYFTPANLEKLRNIMCRWLAQGWGVGLQGISVRSWQSYIWQHIEIGYVQGMCDLLAPLLVILDDGACVLLVPGLGAQSGSHFKDAVDHFVGPQRILDSELFELMHQNGDYTHFYFCYRWFLLDFKRELVYDDVFSVWETIWAAKHVSSAHYVLFIALALVEVYRDIILENNMDFTDIIKFFNEMAERHNTKQVLKLARNLVYKVQTLIENK
ncbi:Small G protein signaling modulator 1, partial [Galemys pyrenaicus]